MLCLQVQVGDHKCTGVGPNKKLAKRSAAEAMLQLLGYSRPSPQPAKPAIKSGDAQVCCHDHSFIVLKGREPLSFSNLGH